MSQSKIAVHLRQTLHQVFRKARCWAQYFFCTSMTYIDPKNKMRFVHFADDTTVFASNSDINNVDATVNRELAGVDNQLKTNRISLERQ